MCVTVVPRVSPSPSLSSLLRLTCRDLGAQGTSSQGTVPRKCQEGPSEEARGEGRGPAGAVRHCQVPPHLPRLRMGLVPAPQGCGFPVESAAGTEAPVLQAGTQGGSSRYPRRAQLAVGQTAS